MPAINWVWRHYHLAAELCETLGHAVRAAWATSEAGSGVLECTEVTEPGGESAVYSPAEIEAMYDAAVGPPPPPAPEPPRTHAVELTTPGGLEAGRVGFHSRADAEQYAARFGLPPHRVRVVELNPQEAARA